ncbi:PQQ-like beta-propeller repeat protein [Streptomyces sp. NBC_01261]|uniref:caspase, EACC1-associated type n=1 Tax=Streptomyces sp. NBC_01261 TaxID=2903802 RepID=UPI002E30B297|nr:PQQ-binding-like beta-propeller repeat protein [Streptomyces sp. NBC_01261]
MDFNRSRAVLMGVWNYRNFPSVPAAENSLARFSALLTSDLCAWPAKNVHIIEDPRKPGDSVDDLVRIFEQATDVALFYFVGHGQVDDEDSLCLCVGETRAEWNRRASTSLAFEVVRKALSHSSARTKVVILDCCFSGLAIDRRRALSSQPRLAPIDLTTGTGAYTICASSGYGLAWFETTPNDEKPQTYFTKYLVDLVESGLVDGPPHLTLRMVFRAIHESLGADAKPLPVARNIDDADSFPFALNAAHPDVAVEPRPDILAEADGDSPLLADGLVSRRDAVTLAAAIAALTVTSYTTAGPSIGRLFPNGGAKVKRLNPGQQMWQYFKPGTYCDDLAIGQDRLYAAVSEQDGSKATILALKPGTGVPLWRKTVTRPDLIRIATVQGRICVATAIDGLQTPSDTRVDVRLLSSADGDAEWAARPFTGRLSAMTASDDTVYLLLQQPQEITTASIHALNAADGTLRWKTVLPFAPDRLVVNGDTLIACPQVNLQQVGTGGVAGIDTKTGRLKWHILKKNDFLGLALWQRTAFVIGASNDDKLNAGSFSGWNFDARTGDFSEWADIGGGFGGLSVFQGVGTLLCGGIFNSGEVFAWDAPTGGQETWRYKGRKAGHVQLVADGHGVVLAAGPNSAGDVGGLGASLVALDPETGEERWHYRTPTHSQDISSLVTDISTVYAGGEGGIIAVSL